MAMKEKTLEDYTKALLKGTEKPIALIRRYYSLNNNGKLEAIYGT